MWGLVDCIIIIITKRTITSRTTVLCTARNILYEQRRVLQYTPARFLAICCLLFGVNNVSETFVPRTRSHFTPQPQQQFFLGTAGKFTFRVKMLQKMSGRGSKLGFSYKKRCESMLFLSDRIIQQQNNKWHVRYATCNKSFFRGNFWILPHFLIILMMRPKNCYFHETSVNMIYAISHLRVVAKRWNIN